MSNDEITEYIAKINRDATQLTEKTAVESFKGILSVITPETAEKFYQAILEDRETIEESGKNQLFYAMVYNLYRNHPAPATRAKFLQALERAKAPIEPLENWTQPPARPPKEYIETTKLSHLIRTFDNACRKRLDISAREKIVQTVEFTPMHGVTLSFRMFHLAVENAIGNLYNTAKQAGVSAFVTPQMIYNEMTGQSGKEARQLKPQMREEISDAMELLRNTNIDITYQPNPRQYGKVSDRIIAAAYTKYRKGDNVVEGWTIWTFPRLFELATQTIKQYATIPRETLNVPGISHTKANIELVHILAQYHWTTSRYKSRHTQIKFSTIYEDLKMENAGKIAHKRIRDNATSILEHWKKTGQITGYEKGRNKFIIYQSQTESLPPGK